MGALDGRRRRRFHTTKKTHNGMTLEAIVERKMRQILMRSSCRFMYIKEHNGGLLWAIV